jgi:hypothetical protein
MYFKTQWIENWEKKVVPESFPAYAEISMIKMPLSPECRTMPQHGTLHFEIAVLAEDE